MHWFVRAVTGTETTTSPSPLHSSARGASLTSRQSRSVPRLHRHPLSPDDQRRQEEPGDQHEQQRRVDGQAG